MASFIFQLSGGRELVDETRAVELLGQAVNLNPSAISLSNKSFTNEAAVKVAERIDTFENIIIADISDIIAGRPEEEALKTLSIISNSLKKFDLIEINISDNALGAKGVTACREILIKKNIQKLYVCNNGLSAEATTLLADILITDGCPPLKVFHFYNNMGGDGAGEAVGRIIKSCVGLEDLRFSATRCMAKGCKAIAESIAEVTMLKRIDLSDNNFGPVAASILAESLQKQVNLEYLNLRDDGFGEEGVNSIIESFSNSPNWTSQLQVLDLSGNEIEADLLKTLCASLPVTLESLYLDDNELTSEGARHLAKRLSGNPPFSALKTLSCCTCEITAAGAYLLAKAVSKLPTFVNLELNGNLITEKGIEEVKSVLMQANKILGDLEDNDEDGDDDLEDVLEETSEKDESVDELATAMGNTKL